MQQVLQGLERTSQGQTVPRIVFTKGGGLWLESLAGIGADALGLDWTVDIGAARARVGDRVALQGNLDPAVLLTEPDIVRAEAVKVLAAFGSGSGHVFNLGHGVSQHTPPDNVAALVDSVHEQSRAYHV
jgi:uroporphyrinogen decarboxylase